MYRLLNLRKAKLSQLHNMSMCSEERNPKVILSKRTCSLCKQVYSFSTVFTRHQSTSTNPQMKSRNKRRRSVKNYAELLIVTEKSSTQHQAKVHKLTPNDLKFLALTSLNLSELYKLKDMMNNSTIIEEHTYNNLTVIDNISSVTESVTIAELALRSVIPNVNEPNTADSSENDKIIKISYNESIVNKIPQELNKEYNISIIDKGPQQLNKEYDKSSVYKIRQELNTGYDKSREELNKVPDLQNEVAFEELEHMETLLPSVSTFHPENLEEEHHEIVQAEDIKEVPKELLKKESETLRQEIVARTVAPYIEVCNSLNLPQKGFNAAWHNRTYIGKKVLTCITSKSINVYNSLLKGFASKGNFPKVETIVDFATQNKVKLNVQSYAAIFECLARSNTADNHLKHIRIYAKEVFKNGINFDGIMNEAVFLNDQRKWVLQAMKAYDRNYVPNYKIPNLQYNNPLLNHLNNEKQLQPQFERCSAQENGIFTKEKLKARIQEQMDIEKLGYITVKSIEAKPNPSPEVLKYRESLAEHVKFWEKTALAAFHRDLASLVAQRQPLNLEPYLRCIPTDDFISIIVDEVKFMAQSSETYSPTVVMLYKGLGHKVYARYKVLRKKKTGVLDKINTIHTKYCTDYVDCHSELDVLPTHIDYLNPRQKWQLTECSLKSRGASIHLDHQPWVPTITQAIGKFLYNIVMHDVKIDVNVMRSNKSTNFLPAFYTVFRHQGRIVKEEVKPHPVLSRLYRGSVPETLTFPSYEVPMKCPPVPWCSVNTGGYLVTTCEVVRLPVQACTQRKRLDEAVPNDLYPSFDSLNQLAAVPWKVNTEILDVILKVFNDGGSARLDVPELPSLLSPPPNVTPDMDKSQRYTIFKQKLQHRRKKAEMYSLWCDCLYRLSLANHFRDEIFWLPHNMDFRGRVYPVPPHLTHLGSDLARSMLVFAESRPLGPEGLDWLKIHLINLTGLKKRDSIADRLDFANEVIDKILDSADNPLTGNMWWAESDEPWQTLACCAEIAKAIRSPDPVKYRSHFPVHQDGSCNGLQHYAALGRDSAGAFSVNLTPASKPQDVYSAVAVLVEERRMKDAANGQEIAKSLEGFIQRKVIKQTVMTTVYGVTRFGARLQIARQLKDLEKFPKENVWPASSYLTNRTFESLRTMFNSTREIQDWFTECARLISSVCSENVEWVTPLGLPIVQPYYKYKKLFSNKGYEAFHIDTYEKPNVMKQKNAFPPNFIHSLDSSHMMLTSLHCERAGITFVSVHDCFWTHPSTVHIMNKICREQFVALHSQPILEDLSIFLTDKYSYRDEEMANDGSPIDLAKKKLNKVVRGLPSTGDFDISKVLNSVYFFS